MRYRCPNCGSSDRLWRGVTVAGWENIDAELQSTGIGEVDTFDGDPDGSYGCGDCDWVGAKTGLIRLGTDGEPLVAPIPGQLAISVPELQLHAAPFAPQEPRG